MFHMRPMLITNPADDPAFRDFVETSLDGLVDTTLSQTILRTRYPDAVVRPRDLSGVQLTVWYVYRDGRWVS